MSTQNKNMFTKKNLIRLIDSMCEDTNVKKRFVEKAHPEYKDTFVVGINIYEEPAYYKKIKYFYKDEEVSEDFSEIRFKKILSYCQMNYLLMNIKILFDNEPPIIVKPKIKYDELKTHIIKAHKFLLFSDSIKAIEYVVNPSYILKCGDYEFEVEEKIIKGLYDNILNEEKIQRRKKLDNEIMSRFSKYNIG